jgi:hypothetical protein
MPVHTIRLRKAWDLESPPGFRVGRIDLPAPRLTLSEPFCLRRTWSAPPGLAPDETLSLRLERLFGLIRLELDGIAQPLTTTLALPAAPGRRSTLSLTCDPSALDEAHRLDWGHVSLVITRPTQTP